MTSEPDSQTADETDARHASKMAKKKVARDKIMATKSGEKGLIIVTTSTRTLVFGSRLSGWDEFE